MRSVRLTLAVFVFCLAATGSIWIGWIYAGPQPRAETLPPLPFTRGPGAAQSLPIGADDHLQNYTSLPDLSRINLLPGASSAMDNASELNGFPTISKEAIERAAGYSSDQSLPELEIPYKLDGGKGPGVLGSADETTP